MAEDILVTAIGKNEANAASCAVDGRGRRSFSQSGKNGAKPDAQGFKPRPHIPERDRFSNHELRFTVNIERYCFTSRERALDVRSSCVPRLNSEDWQRNNPIEDHVRGCHARADVHHTETAKFGPSTRCEVNKTIRSAPPALRSSRSQHTLEPLELFDAFLRRRFLCTSVAPRLMAWNSFAVANLLISKHLHCSQIASRNNSRCCRRTVSNSRRLYCAS